VLLFDPDDVANASSAEAAAAAVAGKSSSSSSNTTSLVTTTAAAAAAAAEDIGRADVDVLALLAKAAGKSSASSSSIALPSGAESGAASAAATAATWEGWIKLDKVRAKSASFSKASLMKAGCTGCHVGVISHLLSPRCRRTTAMHDSHSFTNSSYVLLCTAL
jgi:hypothetical protein